MAKKKKKNTKTSTAPAKKKSPWKLFVAIPIIVLLVIGALPDRGDSRSNDAIPQYTYSVVRKLPHNPESFTQGLLVKDGLLYESTGGYGESKLLRVDPQSGAPLKELKLDNRYFGEGLAFLGGRRIHLTWKEEKLKVYHSETFELLREHSYQGEGWGLTTDGKVFYMSNGSNEITVRDANQFNIIRSMPISAYPKAEFNELEWVNGEIWANIYRTDKVLRINPETGEPLGEIRFKGLPPRADRNGREDVLNGIAWDPKTDQIYVTGKRFSYIYEVAIEEVR